LKGMRVGICLRKRDIMKRIDRNETDICGGAKSIFVSNENGKGGVDRK